MTGSQVISETDTTNPAYKTYAIAKNGQGERKTGPWAYVNHGSVARVKQALYGNKAGFNYKHLSRDNNKGTTVMQNIN